MAVFVTPSTWAEPPPRVPSPAYLAEAKGFYRPEVQALFEQAYKAERRGDFKEALDLFEQALQRDRDNDVEVELGLAQLRAGNYLQAARHLDMALVYGHRLRAHRIDETYAALGECKKHIGTIILHPNVPDTRVFVGEEEVRDLWANHEFFVAPGKHIVKAMKEGYWMNQRYVEVKAGETAEVIIPMQQRIQTQVIGFERPLNVNMRGYSPDPQDGKPTWPKNLIIASVVGMGLGTGALAMGLVFRDTEDAATRRAWTGVAGAGGGLLGLSVIGLGIGIASLPQAPAPSVYIAPSVSNETMGVSATGNW
ncbi:tetratricopeptide repeat protein [Polyangium sp. 15x6]|uniref:tetratricopeptide repeat protein n=1 Tax=Polyangium sp. 15x6 TaxID=3042687 RepID=UPI00249C771B|nr:tetratricopeptide repeat protein [Polyangium sp. 15x6]MDI3288643.1 tetratricopeptide repeat protein [Polyangium sp. 15x6]